MREVWGKEERRRVKILFIFMSLRDYLRFKILKNMGKVSLFRMEGEGERLKWVGKFTRDRALLLFSLYKNEYRNGGETGIANRGVKGFDSLLLREYVRVKEEEYRESVEIPALVTAKEAIPFFLKVSKEKKLILRDRNGFVYLNLLFLVGDSIWIRDFITEVMEEWKVIERNVKGEGNIKEESIKRE